MTARIARVKGKDLVAAPRKAGFDVERQRGSRCFLAHPDGRATVVPVHAGETIGPGLLTKFLRDCIYPRGGLVPRPGFLSAVRG